MKGGHGAVDSGFAISDALHLGWDTADNDVPMHLLPTPYMMVEATDWELHFVNGFCSHCMAMVEGTHA